MVFVRFLGDIEHDNHSRVNRVWRGALEDVHDLIRSTRIIFLIAGEGHEDLSRETVFQYQGEDDRIGHGIIQGAQQDAVVATGVIVGVERVDMGGNQHQRERRIKIGVLPDLSQRSFTEAGVWCCSQQVPNAVDSVGAGEFPAIVGTREREIADKFGQVHLLDYADWSETCAVKRKVLLGCAEFLPAGDWSFGEQERRNQQFSRDQNKRPPCRSGAFPPASFSSLHRRVPFSLILTVSPARTRAVA